MKWQLHIYHQDLQYCEPLEVEGIVDLGRQDSSLPKEQGSTMSSELPMCYPLEDGITRVVVASVKEQRMHRHIQVEPLAEDGTFRLKNLSKGVAIHVSGGQTVAPSSVYDGKSPLEFQVDRWTLRAQVAEQSTVLMQMLPEKPAPPGSAIVDGSHMSSLMQSIGTGSIEPVQLIRWLQATIDVLQEAASSQEFLPRGPSRGGIDRAGRLPGPPARRRGLDHRRRGVATWPWLE